jgi:hypothetical protein
METIENPSTSAEAESGCGEHSISLWEIHLLSLSSSPPEEERELTS